MKQQTKHYLQKPFFSAQKHYKPLSTKSRTGVENIVRQ